MSIEETLETIATNMAEMTVRHNALAQSFELLVSMHNNLEKETARRFSETLQRINRLADFVEAHEERLDDLEGH